MKVYGTDVYAYLIRARQQLDGDSPPHLFYAAFELRCAIESRLRQYLNARDDIAKHKKKGWHMAASEKELAKKFRDGRTIVELLLAVKNMSKELRLFYTPVKKTLVAAGDRLGDFLHCSKADLDYNDSWWSTTREFLEETFKELEFASAGTLLGPPMKSPDGRHINVKSFYHQSHRLSDVFDKFVALPKGTQMNFLVRYHSELPNDATLFLNSWRCEVP